MHQQETASGAEKLKLEPGTLVRDRVHLRSNVTTAVSVIVSSCVVPPLAFHYKFRSCEFDWFNIKADSFWKTRKTFKYRHYWENQSSSPSFESFQDHLRICPWLELFAKKEVKKPHSSCCGPLYLEISFHDMELIQFTLFWLSMCTHYRTHSNPAVIPLHGWEGLRSFSWSPRVIVVCAG